jgi:hypothetical protein
MKHGERDDFGRLNVTDDELMACARGAMITASMSEEAIMRALGCDRFEAEHLIECAHADLARIRCIARRFAESPDAA